MVKESYKRLKFKVTLHRENAQNVYGKKSRQEIKHETRVHSSEWNLSLTQR